MRANVKARLLVAALVAAGLGLAGRGLAGLVAGGGKKPENDCLVALKVEETGADALTSPIKCADCDANCDRDGQTQPNKACTFKVSLCVNQSGCTGAALKSAVGKIKGADVKKLAAPSDLSGAPACGDPTLVTVRVKGKKKLHAGKATVTLTAVSSGKGKQKRKDADKVMLECDPQLAQTCPTTTTTTTLPTAQCECCASHPSLLKFVTTTGTGNCGKLQDAQGNKLEDLTCSGLYFGGKGVAVPLPGSVPDMGTAFTKITACNAATGDLTFGGSSAAESGSIRTCTSSVGTCTAAAAGTCDTTAFTCTGTGICSGGGTCTQGKIGLSCTADSDCDFDCGNDHDCDTCTGGNVGAHCNTTKGGDHQCTCLFGAPLPVPNPTTPAASTCIINTVAQSATGTGSCAGAATVSLPLNSEVFLPGGGDVLPKRCSASTTGGKAGFNCLVPANCPGGACVNDPAIQPCPICNPTTHKCNGGPNEGAPCTPGDSALTSAYPTSHDCPPPHVGADIGPLPIAFGLTTGTASKDAFQTGQGISKVRVFCPFCRVAGGGPFENPPRPCTADGSAGGCTNAGFPSCEQNQSGAFTFALGSHIEETGTPAACLADGAPHASTLASVFCIPPSFNQTVDQNGDLPGPGAISLPGMAQLVTAVSVTTTSTITGTTGPPTTTTTVATTTTISVSTTTTTTIATTTTTLGGATCCGIANGGPTKLRFETVTGSGSVAGSQYHTAAGFTALVKSGLYFGGSGETVPLPSVVPDKGLSFTGTSCSGTTLTLGPLTAAQVPSGGIRTCTSPVGTCTAAAAGTCDTNTFTCTGTGVCTASLCTKGKIGIACSAGSDCDFDCGNDHDCDTCSAGNVGAHCNTLKGGDHECSCLFGAPLPIVNTGVPNASTCVINGVGNRFSSTVSGTSDCVAGTSSLSVPLNSEVYLTADLLGKRCTAATTGGKAGFSCTASAECPGGACVNDPSVQPCPICNATTLKCNGGANQGATCTPGNSAIGGHPEYPTSHDCLTPHVGSEIGGLPIAFALTTGTVTKTSFSTGAGNGKSAIFCAWCKNPLGGFQNPPAPANGCTSNADCGKCNAGSRNGLACTTDDTNATTGCPGATCPGCCGTSCEQNLNGAFAHADADTITEVGEPAPDLSTAVDHSGPSTLVSVFCIPPAYDSTTDTNGGLPGPGAVSLPGMAQLLP